MPLSVSIHCDIGPTAFPWQCAGFLALTCGIAAYGGCSDMRNAFNVARPMTDVIIRNSGRMRRKPCEVLYWCRLETGRRLQSFD